MDTWLGSARVVANILFFFMGLVLILVDIGTRDAGRGTQDYSIDPVSPRDVKQDAITFVGRNVEHHPPK